MKYCYILIFSCISFIAAAQPTIAFQSIVTGINSPVDLVAEPVNNRLFIVEQGGNIKIWNGTSLLSTPFLNINAIISTSGEQGLLSLAFHPQYATNRYFFVWYTNTSGAVTLARYRRDASNADIADASSGVVLLSIAKSFTNHNGAKLNFGPDGYLYFGTGDGGSGNDPSNNAQTGTSLLGKMLRIDVNSFATSAPFYDIPATNPYTTDANVADEILALGVRNPWRWSFDKTTGDMWIADVGQGAWEEVHFRAAADINSPANYGWRCYEGTHINAAVTPCGGPPPNNVFPIYEYPHNSSGGYVVTGGYVYRGTEYPWLQGYYMMVDYSTGNGWLIKSNGSGGWDVTPRTGWLTGISTFGEMNDGSLYAASGTTIYKVTSPNPLPLRLVSFTGRKTDAQHELNWEIQHETQGDQYSLERSTGNQMSFAEIKKETAAASNSYKKYTVNVPAISQPAYYRLKTTHADGSISYSSIVYMNANGALSVKVMRGTGNIIIESNDMIKQVMISDAAGRIIHQCQVNASGMISVQSANLPKGLLVVKVMGEHEIKTEKILN